ncbi:hypothetical protein ACCAA_350072 [Candidatus Accumulibacter aalborgensis]|uniref:Uncharacterized protein n=1 Tax=Candidatus Accumulibacter aalborgensis TaxID=1860102 RepID=A0A1A8XND1_9PROT|nr:hypothetical protein ACCAA_350072 [Candidatus Accumulibacter aalborgensis]
MHIPDGDLIAWDVGADGTAKQASTWRLRLVNLLRRSLADAVADGHVFLQCAHQAARRTSFQVWPQAAAGRAWGLALVRSCVGQGDGQYQAYQGASLLAVRAACPTDARTHGCPERG